MRTRQLLIHTVGSIALVLAVWLMAGCGAVRQTPSPRAINVSLACGIGAHAHDLLSTVMAIKANAREGNPVFAQLPLPVLATVKGAGALGIDRVIRREIAPAHPRAAFWAGMVHCVGINAVAIHNWRVLQQAGGAR